jgi:hypothetical protein
MTDDSDETVNAQLVTEGLARIVKQVPIALVSGMVDRNDVMKSAVALSIA